MFTGYAVSESTRKTLMGLFPPKYPEVIGHHITEKFGVKKTDPAPDAPETVRVVGYADDGHKVEGFLVEVNGSTKRPSGGFYHLTWSIDRSKGAKPKDTNDIMESAVPFAPFDIVVTPKNFHNV